MLLYMNTNNGLTISGTLKKNDHIWVANLPLLKVSSHGLNPYDCIESLRKTLIHITGSDIFEFKLQVSDDGLIMMVSMDAEGFQKFINERNKLYFKENIKIKEDA